MLRRCGRVWCQWLCRPRPYRPRGLKDFLHSTVRTFGPGAGVPMDDPEVSDEFLQLCLDNGCAFTPTLSLSQNNWHFAEHPELLKDPDLRAVLNPAALASFDDPETRANIVGNPSFENRKAAFRQVQAFVKRIYDAGIPVALGTDSGTRNVPMGWGTHHELELYVEGSENGSGSNGADNARSRP